VPEIAGRGVVTNRWRLDADAASAAGVVSAGAGAGAAAASSAGALLLEVVVVLATSPVATSVAISTDVVAGRAPSGATVASSSARTTARLAADVRQMLAARRSSNSSKPLSPPDSLVSKLRVTEAEFFAR
jgi:hypothetical protein